MSTLSTAVQALQAAVRGRVGTIMYAPPAPTDKIVDFPCLMAYPASGRIVGGPQGGFTALHNIIVELHIARKTDLPNEVERALGFAENVPNAFYDALVDGDLLSNGSIQTFGEISYVFGVLSWGDQQTVGFQWEIADIKILHTVT